MPVSGQLKSFQATAGVVSRLVITFVHAPTVISAALIFINTYFAVTIISRFAFTLIRLAASSSEVYTNGVLVTVVDSLSALVNWSSTNFFLSG